jgi:hypothetical protein
MLGQMSIALDRWLTTPPDDGDDDFCPFHAAGWTAAESVARTVMPQHAELWQDEAWIDGFCDCLEMRIQELRGAK